MFSLGYNILEGMATLPLPLASSGVTVHWVRRGEVVPGANETDGLDGRGGLAERRGGQLMVIRRERNDCYGGERERSTKVR